MSRGLGRLQVFIKAAIYEADRAWQAEQDALRAAKSRDMPKGVFWLTWPHIRYLIEENEALNPIPFALTPSLERSAKRALYLLVKRGEIAAMKHGKSLTKYITAETDKQLTESVEGFRETVASMTATNNDGA